MKRSWWTSQNSRWSPTWDTVLWLDGST